jgi:hypothetical protein
VAGFRTAKGLCFPFERNDKPPDSVLGVSIPKIDRIKFDVDGTGSLTRKTETIEGFIWLVLWHDICRCCCNRNDQVHLT